MPFLNLNKKSKSLFLKNCCLSCTILVPNYKMPKIETKKKIGTEKYQLFLFISRPFNKFKYQQNKGVKYY